MRKNYQVLAGMTVDESFIFINIDFRENHFSMTADEVAPIVLTEEDKRERFESFIDGIDSSSKFDMLESYDVAPSQLVETMMEVEDIENLLDCSLTPSHLYHLNGAEMENSEAELYLESVGCGQHTDFEIKEYYIDKQDLEYLMAMWKQYHLSEISSFEEARVNKAIDRHNSIEESEEEFVVRHIEKIFDDTVN